MSLTNGLSSLASLPSPLPPAPELEVFVKSQWDTLFSVLEVFVPSVSAGSGDEKSFISTTELDHAITQLRRYLPDGASDDVARAYLSESIVSESGFQETIIRRFQSFVPPSDAKGLGFILSSLNTAVGSYLLTGYTSPIHTQDLATRTGIVLGWSTARLPLFRNIYRAFSGLAKQTWLATSAQLPRMLDFPAISKHIERNDSHEFKFHDFISPSAPTTLTTDVVIIGSGCGAGVTAAHLSRAGLKCLILEKSYHIPSTHFPMSASAAAVHTLERGGTLITDDASVLILAGSTFGGGGTVNWSASLQPQYAVRKEWASSGLDHFLGTEFQDCLDTVCHRMGVPKATEPHELGKIEHNFANKILLEGARRLGMAVEIVPQNTASNPHSCGSFCTYGCASVIKQGPANCWFPDAAAHGAEFIEGAFVEEVTFSQQDDIKVATGVKATWTSRDRKTTRELTILAKRVIVSAGTLNSPAVLLRSGLTNPHIGANLHLHPTCQVWSLWPHRTDPWEGPILTVAVTALEDQDGAYHGPKIEVVCSTLGYGIVGLPFRPQLSLSAAKDKQSIFATAIDYRLNNAKHGHSTSFISITRDADTGKVYIDRSDPTRRRIRIAYTPSERDRRHILEGQLAGARIAFMMGAKEIDTGNPHSTRWIRPSTLDHTISSDADAHSFTDWLSSVKALGLTSPDPMTMGSAHQMGTCRMSTSSRTGVVDSQGKVWGTEGLYVADASVFPSASGVNPMITTMGISEWIARAIARDVEDAKR